MYRSDMTRFKGWSAAAALDVKTKQREQAEKKKPKETANQITANIIRVVNMQPGCIAYRVNNVGVWDAAKGVHRKGNTEKGLPDITAIVRGQFVGIEVKAGKDKLSPDQLLRKFEIERAGGLYFEARATDEFLKFFVELLKK
jgi:hypothetical protein